MTERDLNPMFDSFLARARLLEEQGVPFPVGAIRVAFTKALAANDRAKALHILERAERLYHGTYSQWVPVRDLLSRAEVLRTTAEELGIDPPPVPEAIGNPRAIIQGGPLSAELFQKARQIAKESTGVLRKAIIAHCKQEAVKLGTLIQAAQRRGENVTEATGAFRSLLQSMKAEPSPVLVERMGSCRKLVADIPSAPAIAFPEIEDADEILLEARILARRIHRIKRNARDAQSAARLMSHVRAALSEDRRAPNPQEEIEVLWGEVKRLSKERRGEVSGATAPAIPPPLRPEEDLPSPYAYPTLPVPDEASDPSTPDGRTRRRPAPRP